MSVDFSVAGRTILVTGACGVLGQQISLEILEGGGNVIASDRFERLQGFDQSIHLDYGDGRLAYFPCDLSSDDEIERLGASVRSSFDALDGIVHNAALVGSSEIAGWHGDFLEQSSAAWQKAIQINLIAPFRLTQEMFSLLESSASPSIVAISSIYGLLGPDWSLYERTEMSNPAAYAASKGGLISLARWLASTLGPRVRVNALALGGIYRNQPRSFVEAYAEKTLLGRMASEQDATGAVLFLLSSASAYITGQTLVVDGGYSIQ